MNIAVECCHPGDILLDVHHGLFLVSRASAGLGSTPTWQHLGTFSSLRGALGEARRCAGVSMRLWFRVGDRHAIPFDGGRVAAGMLPF
jgi:hypothetical protein